MNYAASQNNVIPVINDTPGALSQLQSVIATRTAFDTPFFLMPVRLETRFMKVMRNLFDVALPDTATTINTKIEAARLGIDKLITYEGFADGTIVAAGQEVLDTLADIRTDFVNLPSLDLIGRAQFRHQLEQVHVVMPPLRQKLNRFSESGSLISQFDTVLQQLDATFGSLPDAPVIAGSLSPAGGNLVGLINNAVADNLALGFDDIEPQGSTYINQIPGFINKLSPIATALSNARVAGTAGTDEFTAADFISVWTAMQPAITQLRKLSFYLTGINEPQYIEMQSGVRNLNKNILNGWTNFLLPNAVAKKWLDPIDNWELLTADQIASLPEQITSAFTFLEDAKILLKKLTASFEIDVDSRASVFQQFLAEIDAVSGYLQNNISSPLDDLSGKRLWQSLVAYNSIFNDMQAALEAVMATGADPQAVGYWMVNMAVSVSTLAANWKNLAGIVTATPASPAIFSGGVDVGAPLTGNELESLPGNVVALGQALSSNAAQIQNAIGAILSSNYSSGFGNVSMLVNLVRNGAQLLNAFVANEGDGRIYGPAERKHLLQAITPSVYDQLDVVRNYLSAYNPETRPVARQYLISLNGALAEVSLAWDTIAGNSLRPGLASPWTEVDELWIRVYPDDIFVDSHEEALTQAEKDSGIDYWNAWWAARGDKDKQLAAWRALIGLYGPERAAWIIKVLTPTNLQNVSISTKATTLSTQLNALNNYTSQLLSVNYNPTQLTAMSHHISYYAPQLNLMNATADSMEALPATVAAELTTSVTSAQTNFSVLSNQILSQGEGGMFTPAINDINNHFQTLKGTITHVHVVNSWEDLYNETLLFPTVALKTESWTEPSKTVVLPDRFVFAAIKDKSDGSYSFQHIKVGTAIPDTLQVGIHPGTSSFSLDPSYHNLSLDPQLKWMFDFNEAVNVGMGIIIRLTPAEAAATGGGFDKLLALGVKLQDKSNAVPSGYADFTEFNKKEGKRLLEQLLDNHHYTPDGLSVIKLGTPTNNTDTGNAGFNDAADALAAKSFQVEAGSALFSPTSAKLRKKDGQWLADALGIDYRIFQHIENADRRQISGAISMNRALWPATIGNTISELLNRLFTKDSIARTKEYFTDYVLAGNSLPPIRVGNQPYGILPATAIGRWKWAKKFTGDPAIFDSLIAGKKWDTYSYAQAAGSNADALFEDRYNERIYNALKVLNSSWLELVPDNVKTIDKTKGKASTQQSFIEILGSDALMAEAYSRFFENAATFQNVADYYTGTGGSTIWTNPNVPYHFGTLFNYFNFSGAGTGVGTGLFDDTTFTSQFSTAIGLANAIINGLPMLNVKLLKYDPNTQSRRGLYGINGPTVDEKPLSGSDVLTPIQGFNFIEWLLKASLGEIWNNNNFGSMQSRSLLFLLLRQSVLTAYRDTAWDTLVAKNLFSKAARNAIGNTAGNAAQILNHSDQFILTKWHLLFGSLSSLSANPQLAGAVNYFSEDPVWWPSGSSPLSVNDRFHAIASGLGPDYKNINLGAFLKSPQNTAGTGGYNYSSLYSATDWSSIDSVREAMDELKFLSTADLDRMLREHIDLCTYRLDAWNAGMVNKRLWQHRNVDAGSRQTGICLGAYGWLIDVRPKTYALQEIATNHKPVHLAETSEKIFYDSGNLGFIHTPSVAHALTAALLRSGYVSEKQAADNRFAVNLHSERVKVALSLIDGIRNGQSLNALLGYIFERNLHERYPAMLPLDPYIYSFRRQFPLAVPVAAGAGVSNPRPVNVVDGIELLNSFRISASNYQNAFPAKTLYEIYSNPTLLVGGIPLRGHYPFGFTGTLPAPASTEMDCIIIEIDRLANAIDALGDLAVAEGVFQIAKGNFNRSAAVIEALTEGKNPVEPEIINTPVTGTHLSHKLVAMMTPVAAASAASPWTGIAMTPRALTEPSVNAWMASLLAGIFPAGTLAASGDFPHRIGCTVHFADADGNPATFPVTLADLGVQPIDLVYMIQADGYTSELSKRIAFFIRTNATTFDFTAGVPADVLLDIRFSDASGISNMLASFGEIVSVVSAIADTVKSSRPLKTEDFVPVPNPIVNPGGTVVDHVEILSRAQQLLAGFGTDIRNYFSNQMPASINAGPQFDLLRIKLQEAADYGIDFGYPVAAMEVYPASLPVDPRIIELAQSMLTSGTAIKAEADKRYASASAALNALTPTTAPETVVATALNSIQTLLGGNFRANPQIAFSYYPGLKNSIDAQFSVASTTTGTSGIMRHYQPNDVESAMEDWLFGLARVQEKIGDVETICTLCSGNHPLQDMRPVQFPYVAGGAGVTEDYWLGTEYPASYEPSGDKLSVTIFNYAALTAGTGTYSGIVIDEWTELVPGRTEVTGLAFHYDQPDAKPPQNILLAVSPSISGPWKLDDLWYTLLDTLDMAKIRMVEPDHIKINPQDLPKTEKFEIFRWLLPAIAGEVTPHNITILPNGQFQHTGYQGSESIQQVSFEYNPNNNQIPTPAVANSGGSGGIGTSSGAATKGVDWDSLSADAILGNPTIQGFISSQYTLTEIALTQAQFTANLATS